MAFLRTSLRRLSAEMDRYDGRFRCVQERRAHARWLLVGAEAGGSGEGTGVDGIEKVVNGDHVLKNGQES